MLRIIACRVGRVCRQRTCSQTLCCTSAWHLSGTTSLLQCAFMVH